MNCNEIDIHVLTNDLELGIRSVCNHEKIITVLECFHVTWSLPSRLVLYGQTVMFYLQTLNFEYVLDVRQLE